MFSFWTASAGFLKTVFEKSNYYFLAVIFIFSLNPIAERYLERYPAYHSFWNENRLKLSLGFLFSVILFFSVPAVFQILADETNLLSESLSFYKYKTHTNLIEAVEIFGNTSIINQDTAHRPGMYPFLVSLMHSVSGFRPENSFAVNLILLFLSFISVFRLAEKFTESEEIRIGLPILVLSFPITAICFRSGGFDALNLFFFLVWLHSVHLYLKTEAEPNAEWMIFTSILAGTARYESILLIIPSLFLILTAVFRKNFRLELLTWRTVLSVILFFPLLWQRMVSSSLLNAGDSNKDPISFSYLFPNILNLADFFRNLVPGTFPSSSALFFLCIAGIGVLLWNFRKSEYSSEEKNTILTAFMGLCLVYSVRLAYYFGDLRLPWVHRLSLEAAFVLCIPAAVFLKYLFVDIFKKNIIYYTIIFLIAMQNLSTAAGNQSIRTITTHREFINNLNFLKGFPKEGTLVISGRPGMYVSHGINAVSFDTVLTKTNELENWMNNKIAARVFVFQEIQINTGLSMPYCSLVLPALSLGQAELEYSVTGGTFIRVSRVHLKN
ncbi:MAG TPA: glycosyltransferase family 39 protein [Leptospiraceae bacterium]|nr:glycosyltransferase family 39 protein [Leptospiraceae bacterium]HNF23045.1 glycosyltransferase family 39 protein [Leptospiraceae bacterium]